LQEIEAMTPPNTNPTELDKASNGGPSKPSLCDITIQMLTKRVKELEAFKQGIIDNAPECSACAEGLFCGSVSHPHNDDCIYTVKKDLQSKLAAAEREEEDWSQQYSRLAQRVYELLTKNTCHSPHEVIDILSQQSADVQKMVRSIKELLGCCKQLGLSEINNVYQQGLEALSTPAAQKLPKL
jgi:hypothetical protein